MLSSTVPRSPGSSSEQETKPCNLRLVFRGSDKTASSKAKHNEVKAKKPSIRIIYKNCNKDLSPTVSLFFHNTYVHVHSHKQSPVASSSSRSSNSPPQSQRRGTRARYSSKRFLDSMASEVKTTRRPQSSSTSSLSGMSETNNLSPRADATKSSCGYIFRTETINGVKRVVRHEVPIKQSPPLEDWEGLGMLTDGSADPDSDWDASHHRVFFQRSVPGALIGTVRPEDVRPKRVAASSKPKPAPSTAAFTLTTKRKSSKATTGVSKTASMKTCGAVSRRASPEQLSAALSESAPALSSSPTPAPKHVLKLWGSGIKSP